MRILEPFFFNGFICIHFCCVILLFLISFRWSFAAVPRPFPYFVLGVAPSIRRAYSKQYRETARRSVSLQLHFASLFFFVVFILVTFRLFAYARPCLGSHASVLFSRNKLVFFQPGNQAFCVKGVLSPRIAFSNESWNSLSHRRIPSFDVQRQSSLEFPTMASTIKWFVYFAISSLKSSSHIYDFGYTNLSLVERCHKSCQWDVKKASLPPFNNSGSQMCLMVSQSVFNGRIARRAGRGGREGSRKETEKK